MASCVCVEDLESPTERRSRTLFGSRMRTYLPSGCLSARSAIVRTIPHPLAKLTFIWPAKSRGLYHCEPRIVCREASRGLAREM
jgi:hypothetical protein